MLLPVICLFIAGTLLACSGDSKSEKNSKAVEAMKANLRESSARAAWINREEALKEEAARKEAEARKEEALKEEAARKIAAEEAKKPKIYFRSEFKDLVLGKSKAQVIANVGRPDSTSESSDSRKSYWNYKRRTMDVISNTIDSVVIVAFEFGVASAINH